MFENYSFTVAERFLRYVQIDTQSDPQSASYPSTEKQKDLGRLLVQELKEAGLSDAALDDFGYVYATLPANTDKSAPVICFCAHMDTSPDCTGTGVKPVVHHDPTGITVPRPKLGSQSRVTEKIRISRMPRRKAGSETPIKLTAMNNLENHVSR